MKPRRISVLAVLLGIALGLWLSFRPDPLPPPQPAAPKPGAIAKPGPNPTPSVPPASAPMATARPSSAPTGAPAGPASSPAPAVRPTAPAVATTAPPPADPVLRTVEAVRIDLDQAGLMLRDYRTLYGENPVGTNAEIMQALMGANPRGAKLGPPEGASLNANGELVDRWGTPYFFHQLSKTQMEIISAGPDGKFFTSDDVK